MPRQKAQTSVAPPKPRSVKDIDAARWLQWLDSQYGELRDSGIVAWMDDLRARLYDEYRVSERPQYQLIVDVIVELDGLCRRMVHEGQEMSQDYRMLRNLQLKWVAQIQRHTEEISFSVRQYRDETETLMQVIWQVMNEMLPHDSKIAIMKVLLERLRGALLHPPGGASYMAADQSQPALPPGMVMVDALAGERG